MSNTNPLMIIRILLIISLVLTLIVSLAETIIKLLRSMQRSELHVVEWSDFYYGEQEASETWERLLQDVDFGGLDDVG